MLQDLDISKKEFSPVGISVGDIYELVNTGKPYPSAVPILLKLLETGIEDLVLKEGVIRALAVREAIGKANTILINEYIKTPKDKMLLRWAIGNTFYTIITTDDIEDILSIVQDKTNGISRQMFVAALGKVKSTKVEDVLIDLLADDDVAAHAIEALGRMKSKKSIERLTTFLSHSKTLLRKEAQKALKKIEKSAC